MSIVDKMSDEFKHRRDVFVAGLNKIKGFSCRRCRKVRLRIPTFTRRLAVKKACSTRCLGLAGVAGLSGTAFGAYGEGYLRFSVANSHSEDLRQGVTRIEAWTAKGL